MADDVAVMQRGEIVERGTVRAVLKNPQHACTRALLDALPARRHAARLAAAAALMTASSGAAATGGTAARGAAAAAEHG
jgi:ABC-type dipeptide/oligopeptide/nickel transport system ATPase component